MSNNINQPPINNDEANNNETSKPLPSEVDNTLNMLRSIGDPDTLFSKSISENAPPEKPQFPTGDEPIAEAKVIKHSMILRYLLANVALVDFKSVKKTHVLFMVVEYIRKLSQNSGWDLSYMDNIYRVYNGQYWKDVNKLRIRAFLGKVAERMGMPEPDAAHYNFQDELLLQFQSQAVVIPDIKEEAPVKLNFLNGTVWFTESGPEFMPFSAKDYLTHQLKYLYDPDAKAPVFQKFLDQMLPNNIWHTVLHEFLAYPLMPIELKLEKMLLLLGGGANGKSVIFEIVVKLFGRENVSSYSLQSLTAHNSNSRPMIGDMLLNFSTEISGKLEKSFFKQMISGEPVEARKLYQQSFIMRKYAKLIFNCNELPTGVELTDAFFRRFLIIPFEVTIPAASQDKQLANKIIATELPGVFNMVVEAYNRLIVQGKFTEDPAIDEQIEKFRTQSDNVKQFVDALQYRPSVEKEVTLKQMHSEYKDYCSTSGFFPCAITTFGTRLKNYGFFITRKSAGNVVHAVIIKQVIPDQSNTHLLNSKT